MVQILVLGASGYIGYTVATALRRAGHLVYALLRDTASDKAASLQRNEVLVSLGDLQDRSTWTFFVDRVDVVIDVAATSLGNTIFEAVLEAASSRSREGPKLTFIYTSGTWVHGDSRQQVTDRTPLPYYRIRATAEGYPPRVITSWRPTLEGRMLSASTKEVMDVVIIRPGDVFGGASPDFAIWFDPLLQARDGKGARRISIVGKENALIATVHRDDLAEAYWLIVEKSSILASMSYPVLNVANPPESLGQIISAAAQELSIDTSSIDYVNSVENGWDEAMSTSTNVSCERARDLLIWTPRHPSLTAGIHIYLKAYLANK